MAGITLTPRKKILFIATYRKDRAPSQRFRFEQYLDYLNHNGYECDVSPLLATPAEDKIMYGGKNIPLKIWVGLKMVMRRIHNLLHKNDYDIIFISREGFKTGSIFFERQLKKSRAKMIFDFDDAVWIDAISKNNRIFRALKNAGKTSGIIRLADLVFAGNTYLSDYARKFNSNVVIIPTTIDTDGYQQVQKKESREVVIGWSGSITTIQHFEFAVPAIRILQEKYKDRLRIKVVGDAQYENEELGIRGLPWKLESELDDLREMDIGIMPLPDTEWTWGKCGLKGLQYMALGIPTVMSPVGVNKEIIQHGHNGFLCHETAEWVEVISRLIEDRDLRHKVGAAGRETVVEKYSFHAVKEKYKAYFDSLAER